MLSYLMTAEHSNATSALNPNAKVFVATVFSVPCLFCRCLLANVRYFPLLSALHAGWISSDYYQSNLLSGGNPLSRSYFDTTRR